MELTEKCPVCGKQCNPKFSYVYWGAPGYIHEGEGCWWTAGVKYSIDSRWKPEPLTIWQRIKKHGLKARIF